MSHSCLTHPAICSLIAVLACIFPAAPFGQPACGQDRGALVVEQPQREVLLARRPPLRAAAVGDIRVTLSVRLSASKVPRFVMANRTIEEPESAPPVFAVSAEVEQYFAAAAQAAIDDINRLIRLDDKQQAKLKLAAMGDLSRVNREARDVYDKFAALSPRDQAEILVVLEELALLNASVKEGVFRSESMFSRVLASSLSRTQSEQLIQAQFETHLSGHFVVPPLLPHLARHADARSLKLTHRQRQQLAKIMLAYSQRLVEPILWWEPRQVTALIKSIEPKEVAEFLEPAQLQAIQHLTAEPVQLEFRQ